MFERAVKFTRKKNREERSQPRQLLHPRIQERRRRNPEVDQVDAHVAANVTKVTLKSAHQVVQGVGRTVFPMLAYRLDDERCKHAV